MSASVSPEAAAVIEPAATRVRDPISGRSVWVAGLVQQGRIDGETLHVVLGATPSHGAEDLGRMREALTRNIEQLGWKGPVKVAVRPAMAPGVGGGDTGGGKAGGGHGHSHDHGHGGGHGGRGAGGTPLRGMEGGGMQPHGGPIHKQPIAGVKRIVAVASGKGGVGKSTVATNLAVGLALSGWKVGIMDADIYGPSVPTMLKVGGKVYANADKKIVPMENYGIKAMSIGFLVDDSEPIIWRGPMVMGVVRQFLQDVAWGDLDVLLIDLPPGTGDAQLTMIQAVDLTGAVVVTTPQDVAVLDAVRGVEMFRKLDVPVLGIIENMAWMDLPDGSRIHPFGSGGGERTAQRYGVPLLAHVPLDIRVREGGDAGRPAALDEHGAGAVFRDVARTVRETLS
ncbi:MAG: Mrp/NBP35 family ATP-binding protein [Alphaproteobacteria bacterium]|nr:Mrp/NBP35 family ATP-binding protein [Alphaproteobacteria bacterium]